MMIRQCTPCRVMGSWEIKHTIVRGRLPYESPFEDSTIACLLPCILCMVQDKSHKQDKSWSLDICICAAPLFWPNCITLEHIDRVQDLLIAMPGQSAMVV